MLQFFKILKYSGLLLLLFSGLVCDAQPQNWLPGYRYRKKITINKSKVEHNAVGVFSWPNFPVLVELEDPSLRHLEDAFENKVTHPEGLDIAFSTAISPVATLKFQLVSYHAQTGKLVCWVILPELQTKTSTALATSFYFYYGSAVLHQPHDPVVKSMWNLAYYHVQDFNENAEGMIGTGRSFNGVSDQKLLEPHSNTAYTLSAWIKLNESGKEQMIVSNDSAGIGGYQLLVNKENRLVFTVKRLTSVRTFTGSSILNLNEWYYVSVSLNSISLRILKNGVSEYTNASLNFTAALPAQVVIGASKSGEQFFNGIIDDFRISKTAKTTPLLLTEYVNQRDPSGFYSVEAEVANPLLEPYAFTFLGTKNSDYLSGTNWISGAYPGDNKNIIIRSGLPAAISTNVVMNKLKLEPGAQINLTGQLQVLQNTELNQGSSISSSPNKVAHLQLEGNVINNGSINLIDPQSKLVFSGNSTNARFTGGGTATVSVLEVNKPSAGSMLVLSAPLQVMNSLKLINGELNANGQLVLLSHNGTTAALHPVPPTASISGQVQVQSFVDGTFPFPATGRGWRLLSSPVIHTTVNGNEQYHLQAIKNSIFVTGKAGTAKGFDASPNNGATIYTHNQSLPGTLAQKYVPIPDMQVQIPLGKGFFVFSRGNRMLPNAYQQQIQSPPFANAEPYILTYTGRLFTGDLTVEVFNNNKGGVGDGFNLLGNPYAAPIRWGSLEKTNVGPFIWLFDPLNNSYHVSDDPNELIQPGAGFFIKVNEGADSGSIVFSEGSKVVL